MANTLLSLAVKYLSRKDYSQESLRNKLSVYCDDNSEIDSVIEHLKIKGLISDKRFVNNIIDKYSMNYGYSFIIKLLKSNGIDIDVFLEEISFLKESELERAHSLIKRKFSKGVSADIKAYAKHARFLGNRGFAKDAIYKVIKSIFHNID
ncbi:regulatory protein [Candidatus Kinetoplastibacterium blastocrithidii TCC012E]|uniref:Regulatory protein RecX n=1 Tax=Candidatus Kinetoplastidibacterium blastocrithidiae TCC012E TaxID=1208922 RepID=M1LAZ9_9PROT|nr:RecX family transcriptional regulator [Candidatus Kinetoplastibacterium blastocrithidii]AFZ83524.1 regulatory protein [Candidatus Kinetoplastibacterium blastocrithidii (ex Strigomonas culicis)]AGF49643.1 regulatory protein [Candidatus Kinetoplastibacterium blastocrithidii TCC012E]